MLPRRGNLFRCIFAHIVFFVAAEKNHFSKWINTDENVALHQFETILNVGIQDCIETCKSKKGCKYINYNTQAHSCAFIGVTSDNEDPLIKEDKRGYVFGNKSEWNMDKTTFVVTVKIVESEVKKVRPGTIIHIAKTRDKYVVCDDCDNHGVCGKKELTGDINSRCQHSGCEPPVQLPLTVVYGNMFSVGASIKYECTDGYKPILINDSSNPITDQHVLPESYISAVCQENGKWNLSSFLCLPECTTLLYHVGLPNIARGKPVTMSSQFNRDSPAKLMVDGNLDNKWPCASTNKENNPWALIDLDQSYKVTSLYIVNRMDCCTSRLHNLAIAIGDDPSNLVRAAYRQEAIGCDFSFNLGGGIRGRFIKLQIESYEYLTICELEVYTG